MGVHWLVINDLIFSWLLIFWPKNFLSSDYSAVKSVLITDFEAKILLITHFGPKNLLTMDFGGAPLRPSLILDYQEIVNTGTPEMSHLMTKPTKWLCTQRRLRSAWASTQSDQSLCCPHEESLGPYLPIERTVKTLIRLGGCPSWSESSLGTNASLLVLSQSGSDLSLRWAQMPVCWFWHEAAQLLL